MTASEALSGSRRRGVPAPSTAPVLVRPDPSDAAGTLREKVITGLEGASADVVVDLRDVADLSNVELGVLVGARAWQRARNRRLTVVIRPGSAVDAALVRAGLRGLFDVSADDGTSPRATRA